MSSTAALEYNTNGELTIKNRQNESTGNSLKFRTSASESNKLNKILDISQNNNTRLRIDDKGSGSITIEGDYKDLSDKKNSYINLTSNNLISPKTGDVNSSLYLHPNNISLRTESYYENDKSSKQGINNSITFNYGYNIDSKIVIQNNDYKLINDSKYENQSVSNITLDKNSIKLSKYDNDPKISKFIDIKNDGIEINSGEKNIILTNNNIRIESGLIEGRRCLKINQVDGQNALMYQDDALYINKLNLNGKLIDSILISNTSGSANNQLITLGYANDVFAPKSTVPGIQNYPIPKPETGEVLTKVEDNFPTDFISYTEYTLFTGLIPKVDTLWFETGRTYYNISFTLLISAGETNPPSFDDIKRFVANLKLSLNLGKYYPINSTFKINLSTSKILLINNCSFVLNELPSNINDMNFTIRGLNCSSDISNVQIDLSSPSKENPNCLIQSFGIQI